MLGAIIFHYAAGEFSAGVLGVEDIFTHRAVAWRRQEARDLLLQGMMLESGDES